jgi:hypothetical protein
MDGRHAREKAAMQAKYQQQLATTATSDRPQFQQQHQQELKALQDRQLQERTALLKRQQAELKKQGAT